MADQSDMSECHVDQTDDRQTLITYAVPETHVPDPVTEIDLTTSVDFIPCHFGSEIRRSESWDIMESPMPSGCDVCQTEEDKLRLLQAQVFIEDAAMYRSIDHKVDYKSLKLYQLYHSRSIALLRMLVILVIHMLAFIEYPSSLSVTSDIRYNTKRINIPCGITEAIELLCLLYLLVDVIVKSRIYGYQYLRVNRWLTVEVIVLGISFIDWGISVGFGCSEIIRIRRMLRPVFIIQNSSLMKKIINSLRKTLSQILGVLLLMALHLYIFTLFGMLLIPQPRAEHLDGMEYVDASRNSTYFRTLPEAFINLLVLLTTSNNPDVTLPAYNQNRLYAVFFIIFLIIGLYCFMNMLTAIVYNQFRGYFLRSMQSSLMRRRLGQRAAFEALKHKSMALRASDISDHNNDDNNSLSSNVPISHWVIVKDLKEVITKAKISKEMKALLENTITSGFNENQMLSWNNFLSVLCMMEMDKSHKEKPSVRWFNHRHLVTVQKIVSHRYCSFFGNFMAFINVILISFELATEYDKSLSSSKSALRIINFLFILYYVVEQSLILVCMGWHRYRYNWANLYDGSIVIILLFSELVTVSLYGFPFFSAKEVHGDYILWNIVRIVNILIMFRLLRVIWHIHAMAIVVHTLIDLIRNLKAFGGILVVMYYFFAMLGMELFQGAITYDESKNNKSVLKCGSYEQLEYWANNFDDFAAAIVVLWNVMVVNNWYVFLDAYDKYTNPWSRIFFIVWWLASVVIVLNLFTALILENFIMKWDRFCDPHRLEQNRDNSTASYSINTLTVHDIFKPNLKEPSEDEIVEEMNKLKYFNVHT